MTFPQRLVEASKGIRVLTFTVVEMVLASVLFVSDWENFSRLDSRAPLVLGMIIIASTVLTPLLAWVYVRRFRSLSETEEPERIESFHIDPFITGRWAAVCEDYDIDPATEPRAEIERFPAELGDLLILCSTYQMPDLPAIDREEVEVQMLDIMDACLSALAQKREDEKVARRDAASLHADHMLEMTRPAN